MKIKIVKLENSEKAIYQTIENVQIAFIQLDENDKNSLMKEFFIRDNESEKITVIPTDKITIM